MPPSLPEWSYIRTVEPSRRVSRKAKAIGFGPTVATLVAQQFLLKGAIVQFVKMPIVPIPNSIIFQYNPDPLQRTLTPYAPPA